MHNIDIGRLVVADLQPGVGSLRLRLHPDGSVQSDCLAVQHSANVNLFEVLRIDCQPIEDDALNKLGVLVRISKPAWVWHSLGEEGTHLE